MFKELLEQSKLSCVSAHQGYAELLNDDGGKLLQDYIDLGVKYIVIPWTPKEKFGTAATFFEILSRIKELYELLAPHGIKLAYHNHDYEFEQLNGKVLFDEIFNTVGRDKLSPELDICWADYAGFSPIEVIKQYSGCIEIMHLKNYTCSKKTDEQVYELVGKESEKLANVSDFRFQTLDVGKIDIPKVIACAKQHGIKYAFVEMDDRYEQDSLVCAATSAKFLQKY